MRLRCRTELNCGFWVCLIIPTNNADGLTFTMQTGFRFCCTCFCGFSVWLIRVRCSLYADDTQLYLHISAANWEAAFARLVDWMPRRHCSVFTWYQLAKVDGSVLVANGPVADLLPVVTCLGVTIDQELAFADHIRRLTGRCFHCLRQLRSIRRMLTTDTIITLVNTGCQSDWLLQRSPRWRTRRPPAAAPSSSQRCSSTNCP